ncbi:MAG TPA: hypothetical protein VGG45_15330 [Terracidiphilus sp.]|jgi:hypothetical protein
MKKVSRSRRIIFPHKRHLDGTIESICGQCFSTVAAAVPERELQIAENAHVCKGLKLSKILRPLDRN